MPPAARRSPIPGLGTGAAGVFVLVVAFSLPALVALRSQARLEEIRASAARTEALARIQTRLQQSIVDDASASLLANVLIVDAMRTALAELSASGLVSSSETQRVAELRSLVARRNVLPPAVLLDGVALMQSLVERETVAQARLAAELGSDARREVNLAIWGFLTVGALAGLLLWAFVVRPLRGLRLLLARLGEGRYEPAPTAGVHALLQPVFDGYNQLAIRLTELEAAHRDRARTLEDAIRAASSTLLEQHHALARSERLAAVGETAAGVAHDLRNPLAGASVALQNLRQDLVGDEGITSRLDMVSGELDRATRTLNDYLRYARQPPESFVSFEVAPLVNDLVGLLRYQAPASVRLEVAVTDNIEVTLPRERLRQALMNLVLNSLQALEGASGRVVIRARQSGDLLELVVEDDGPGFPESILRWGVRPFTTSREPGSGLGLTIARRVAQDLGGTFELYNIDPQGAGVVMRIPSDA